MFSFTRHQELGSSPYLVSVMTLPSQKKYSLMQFVLFLQELSLRKSHGKPLVQIFLHCQHFINTSILYSFFKNIGKYSVVENPVRILVYSAGMVRTTHLPKLLSYSSFNLVKFSQRVRTGSDDSKGEESSQPEFEKSTYKIRWNDDFNLRGIGFYVSVKSLAVHSTCTMKQRNITLCNRHKYMRKTFEE